MVAVPTSTRFPSRSSRSQPMASLQNKKAARAPMNVVKMPTGSAGLSVRPSVADLRTLNRKGEPSVRQSASATVQVLPSTAAIPIWLKGLMGTQKVLTPLTVLLVSAMAAAYGWTVYTQQAWGEQYQRLQYLTRQERQLVAADEVYKNQLAQEAISPSSGLVTSTLSNTVFLEAPPPPPVAVVVPLSPVAEEAIPPLDRPFGY